jgi:hypothetical protein
VLTPKIATVAARLLDGVWDRVKANSVIRAASLKTLRPEDRRKEERMGKKGSLSKPVQEKQEEEKQEEEKAVNPCSPLNRSLE